MYSISWNKYWYIVGNRLYWTCTGCKCFSPYLLTPRCRVLLEQLTGLELFKKFPAFYRTRRFITALTSLHHPSLPWASPIQSIYPHPTFWKSVLILSTHLRLRLPSGLFPSGFPTRPYTPSSPHPYAPHAQPIPLRFRMVLVWNLLKFRLEIFIIPLSSCDFHRYPHQLTF